MNAKHKVLLDKLLYTDDQGITVWYCISRTRIYAIPCTTWALGRLNTPYLKTEDEWEEILFQPVGYGKKHLVIIVLRENEFVNRIFWSSLTFIPMESCNSKFLVFFQMIECYVFGPSGVFWIHGEPSPTDMQLNGFDFTDDIAFLSYTQQVKTVCVTAAFEAIGLNIHVIQNDRTLLSQMDMKITQIFGVR